MTHTSYVCNKDSIELLVSDSAGVYIPQSFIDGFDYRNWGIDIDDVKVILDGPDNEFYWDSWENVLNNAKFVDKDGNEWTLMHDGDLWAVRHDYVYEEC